MTVYAQRILDLRLTRFIVSGSTSIKSHCIFSHWSEVGAAGNGTPNPAAVFYFHGFAGACNQQLLPAEETIPKKPEEVADQEKVL